MPDRAPTLEAAGEALAKQAARMVSLVANRQRRGELCGADEWWLQEMARELEAARRAWNAAWARREG